MKDLKSRTLRGGFAKGAALGANFVLRMTSVMILARLLEPRDFGLLGMVTAFTGILSLFRDFGLSAAAIQVATLSEEQSSTLFWINVLAGAVLTGAAMIFAPIISSFYHEPRLLLVTMAVSISFLINGVGVQHSAVLQRQMRFGALAAIDVIALIVSTVTAICAAELGYGYWSLVVMTICLPLVTTCGLWAYARWIPGMPRRGIGIRALMRFGGAVTLNSFVVYLASNLDKVLLGRFWGSEALGIYGRAYQLIRIPTDTMNSGVGEVAFAALSRLQDEPSRLKSYFLKGYALVLGCTLPLTITCGLFANDLIIVLLGPKWKEAIPIFRLLAPTILAFAIANPLGWLLSSLGLVDRGLKIALVAAPLMIASYFIGLPYGPKGVALAYSVVMTLWAIPAIRWCVHGTVFSFWDIVRVISRPLGSVIPAAGLAMGASILLGPMLTPLPRLLLEGGILFLTYAWVLLFVAGEKTLYLELYRGIRGTMPDTKKDMLSAL